MRDTRDWAALDDGPAGLIAERVLAFDVADYLRFRAVCRSWRQCSADPHAHGSLDRRFHPRSWTMLWEELAAPDRRSFLNTSTGECVQVDIPELRDHELLALTPEGLLVLVPRPPHTTVRLLNPFTRHLTELPPLTTLLPSEDHHLILDRDPHFRQDFAAWGSGIAYDNSTVVLCLERLGMLGIAKPGDDHWTLLNYDDRFSTTAPLMFAGRFYCVDLDYGVMVLETGEDQPPRLEVAAKVKLLLSRSWDRVHLVNNFGDLMLVHCKDTSGTLGWQYNVYGMDLDTGTLFPANSLGGTGRALFVGMHCSLSVSLEGFPSGSLSADTIYLSFVDYAREFADYERKLLKVGAYHLADGTIEPPYSLMPRPHTLVDCLSLLHTAIETIPVP